MLDLTPDVRDAPDAVPAPRFRGALRLDQVRFAYEAEHPVLSGIDFAVQAGQRVAIVGPSGSGKSTLLGLIVRLHDPTGGRVFVDGRDVRGVTLATLRAQVSMVLQDTLLFATTIRENIAYGTPGATAADVEAAARLAAADTFIRALPDGYDTVVGERGVTLSKGQRQRIAIARAAIRQAPILLLDEPVVGLDEENARAVTDALERLAAGRTTLLVTHDLRHAARCDLVLLVEHGRIAERGTHAELLRRGGRYAALYRAQAAARTHHLDVEDTHAVAG